MTHHPDQIRTKPARSPKTCPPDTSDMADVRSVEGQKGLIIWILVTFLEKDGIDDLGDYLEHVGFDLRAVPDKRQLLAAWLGHYRVRAGVYDVDRAFSDFTSWAPIAARIEELKVKCDGFSQLIDGV